MKKISDETISLLKSYFALTVIAEMETETYNKVVTDILKANQFKVDMSLVKSYGDYEDIYNSEYVITSPSDDALYVFMSEEDVEKFKADQKAAGVMNEDGTSVHLCTESNMRDTLRLFIKSCLKDLEMKDMLDEFISLEYFNKLKQLCVNLAVSYCKEMEIELNIAA